MILPISLKRSKYRLDRNKRCGTITAKVQDVMELAEYIEERAPLVKKNKYTEYYIINSSYFDQIFHDEIEQTKLE